MAPLFSPMAFAVGALAMFLLDPARGRRRRALLRDRMAHAVGALGDAADAGMRDLENRRRSVLPRLRAAFMRQPASDRVLAERVRAKLGRYVSHPHSIVVTASDGRVSLTGAILRHEHASFLGAVQKVPGVMAVDDRLVVHKTALGVSELQGGRMRRGERYELAQDHWSPGVRLAAGTLGATLMASALRGGARGWLLATAGAVLLLRSTANKPLRQLAGVRGRRGIDVQKTITIDAPPETVFEYLARYENHPDVMRNVRKVEKTGEGRSHWVVAGPAGTEVHWDAVTTQLIPNEMIAWRTVEGSPIAHAGIMRLEECDGGTRLHVRMTYNPPAALAGHAVAKLFGADPKTELGEDLMRFKQRLESEARRAEADVSVSSVTPGM